MRRHQIIAAASLVLAFGLTTSAWGQCPKLVVQVDNDIKGSGYSEVKPKNWLSNSVGSCYKNYRYLSHTVGDGTRKGKAIWQPKITVTGWYEVKTSYRATTNRTTSAAYYLHDDAGGKKKVVINQKHSGDCTKKVLGTIYCKVGGSCRLVLDGDDGKSDAADITSFTLTKCSGTPPKNPCAGISAHAKYELCNWTATTCSGVYTNGDGCKKYCAAAGMTCTGRWHGDPGCKKEATKIACNASNTHKSNWCDCKGTVKVDSGTPPKKDSGPPPKKDTGTPPKKDSGPPPKKDTGTPPADKGTPPATDAAPAQDLPGVDSGAAPQTDGEAPGPEISSGCDDCAVSGRPSPLTPPVLLLGLLLLRCRRRQ